MLTFLEIALEVSECDHFLLIGLQLLPISITQVLLYCLVIFLVNFINQRLNFRCDMDPI